MYFIRSGGHWRKLDPKTGTVEGWHHQPRFLYMDDGRLHLAPTAAVLRGLRALDAGRPTCIGIGDSLPERKVTRRNSSNRRRRQHRDERHGHRHRDKECGRWCSNEGQGYEVDVNCNDIDKLNPNTVSVLKQKIALPTPDPRNTNSVTCVRPEQRPTKRTLLASSTNDKGVQTDRQTTKAKRQKYSEQNFEKTVRNVACDSSSATSYSSRLNYKELIVDESDVELLRDFLVKNTTFIPNVDLHMYDADNDYKSKVFYKINPMVRVERSRLMEKMLRDSQSKKNELTLKDFATKLGLTRVTDVLDKKRYKTRNSIKGDKLGSQSIHIDDEDKENAKTKHVKRLSSNVNKDNENSKKYESTSQSSDSSSLDVIKSSRDVTSDSDVSSEIQRKTRSNINHNNNNTTRLRPRTENIGKIFSNKSRSCDVLKIRKHDAASEIEDSLKIQRKTRLSHTQKNTSEMRANTTNSAINSILRCDILKRSRDDVTSDSDDHSKVKRKTRSSSRQNHTLESKILNSATVSSPQKQVSFRQTPTKHLAKTVESTIIKQFTANKPPSPILKPKEKTFAKKGSSTSNTSNSTNKPVQTSTTRHTVKSTVGLHRPKFKRSSVPAGREYSGLEDHTIVTWISSGNSRDRLVNGNRVWRQLQGEYWRLSGVSRSWHSLRNRYLRYILPHLGNLALPPDQVARLRAAAATGEIKTGKLRSPARAHPPARARSRSPILKSAWSLRPRPRFDDTLKDQGNIAPTDSKTPRVLRPIRSSATPKSPAPDPASVPAPTPAPASTSTPVKQTRLRRLFNPNAASSAVNSPRGKD